MNGKMVQKAGIGLTQSKELTLTAGDHLVVHLEDDGGDRHFFLVFTSTDEKDKISFRRINFRIVHDLNMVDFTADEYEQHTHRALAQDYTSTLTSVRSSSESMWGDLSKCTLICLMDQDMFP